MARPLRFVTPGQFVEVTTRTIQSRFLLRPSAELNAALLAVFGRALAHHEVVLHGFAVLSNHIHLLMTVADGRELASFMRFVNRNISSAVGRLHDLRGPLGVARVLAQNPHARPRRSDRSPAPLVHAATRRAREAFRAVYRAFVDSFRAAAERLRQGEVAVEFPLHAFPPAAPFVGGRRSVVASP